MPYQTTHSTPAATPADISRYMNQLGEQARLAASHLARANSHTKNLALQAIANALLSQKSAILDANAKDMQLGAEKDLAPALLDRLALTPSRFDAMVQGLKDVATLADPIGKITEMTYRPSGIQLGKMRVPLGVIGMIYESRPNVTIEAASLAIKSGNAIILRGGSEAFYSNQALADCVKTGLMQTDLPPHCVQIIDTTDRQAVQALITLSNYVDVIIPRGGKGLVATITDNARIPVIKHLDGNCHTFIDKAADAAMAVAISVNAKTSRYGTCNTMETLLVDQAIAEAVLPDIATAIVNADNAMQLRGCQDTLAILTPISALANHLSPATDSDWDTEFLAPILAIKVVAGIDEAISHINRHGSHHTDAIVTNDYAASLRFLREVDSASVMVNASTRFADGFEYGLGAEIGISTDKIHARGPVGLHGLTSQKWIVLGHGEIRQ